MCFGASKQKSSQTSTVSLPSWLDNTLRGNSQQAQALASTPYQAWTGSSYTPLNDTQTGAEGITSGIAGYTPQNVTAGQIGSTDLSSYMNPYTQSVIDASNADIDHSTAQSMEAAKGAAAKAGAFGGDRQGIEQAELASQGARTKATTNAALYNQNFTQAQAAATADINRNLSAATQNQAAGLQGAGLNLNAANQLFQQGTVDQQSQEVGRQFDYQQYQNQINDPYNKLSWAQGIASGTAPYYTTQTSTATTPGPSVFGQIMGGLSSLGGIASGIAALKDGGVADDGMHPEVRSALRRLYADGGVVSYDEDGSESWEPEQPAASTIADMNAMIAKRRHALPHERTMYGRNAGLVARRDALLDASPEALAAASAGRSSAPQIPGGYREPAAGRNEMGAWTAGLPRATGVIPGAGSGIAMARREPVAGGGSDADAAPSMGGMTGDERMSDTEAQRLYPASVPAGAPEDGRRFPGIVQAGAAETRQIGDPSLLRDSQRELATAAAMPGQGSQATPYTAPYLDAAPARSGIAQAVRNGDREQDPEEARRDNLLNLSTVLLSAGGGMLASRAPGLGNVGEGLVQAAGALKHIQGTREQRADRRLEREIRREDRADDRAWRERTHSETLAERRERAEADRAARLELAGMRQTNEPEQWSDGERVINGEKVPGQVSSRGRFVPFRPPQDPKDERATTAVRTRAVNEARDEAEKRFEPGPERDAWVRNRSDELFAQYRGEVPAAATPTEGQGAPKPKLPDLPVSALENLNKNVTQLRDLDGVIGRYDTSKGEGTGFLYGLTPDFIASRVNPSGVLNRADIARIGAIKIHDLTGAAQTISEVARLRPFIPNIGDDPEVTKQKLAGLRKAYAEEMQSRIDTFGRYKIPEAATAAVRGGGGGGPKPGDIQDGYRFKGGDPAKPESWERAR